MTIEIITVSAEKATEIINLAVDELQAGSIAKSNQNCYLAKDGDKYIAIDNTNGDCWVEEFNSLYAANLWLSGDMDAEEAGDADIAILRVAEALQSHPWYENETIERCREMAEYTIMNLRKGAK